MVPVHQNLRDKHKIGELHGEAVAHRRCRGVRDRQRLLGGRRRLGGVLEHKEQPSKLRGKKNPN
jgi:hypothetical protein